MPKKKKRATQARPKRVWKKPRRNRHDINKKLQRKTKVKFAKKSLAPQSPSLPVRPTPPPMPDDSRVFTIEIDSIRAETTIGDLIVAFPRTRDVLMKHGLRFDVEEAGYLYMTLNVFSAIHGLAISNLIQELDVASKELPPPPLVQPLRQIAPPPTT